MDLFWIIYLLDVLDISKGAGVFGGLSLGLFVTGKMLLATHDPKYYEETVNIGKILSSKIVGVSSVCLIIVGIILPSKDTSYKMLAAYGVTEAYVAAQESDKVQAIAGKSLKVLEKAMDDYLGEGE